MKKFYYILTVLVVVGGCSAGGDRNPPIISSVDQAATSCAPVCDNDQYCMNVSDSFVCIDQPCMTNQDCSYLSGSLYVIKQCDVSEAIHKCVNPLSMPVNPGDEER
ncbi:MAG: hypothetical protein V1647_03915 [Pseudomonadota bacterium]